jgi:hypothetical protein
VWGWGHRYEYYSVLSAVVNADLYIYRPREMQPPRKRLKKCQPNFEVGQPALMKYVMKAVDTLVCPMEPHVCLHKAEHWDLIRPVNVHHTSAQRESLVRVYLARSSDVEQKVIRMVCGFNNPAWLYTVEKVEDIAMNLLMNEEWLHAHWPQKSALVRRGDYELLIVAVCPFPKEVRSLLLSYMPDLTACPAGYNKRYFR